MVAGTLEATVLVATPWLPAGQLKFEFGVSKRPAQKAAEDYTKRTKEIQDAGLDAKDFSFVFATPRRWKGAAKWAADRQAEGVWRDVQVLDGDDIEAWLESTLAVHCWISEQIGLKPHGVETFESWWMSFQSRTRPALPGRLFLAGRGAQRDELLAQINRPGDSIGVRAGWRDDALAFAVVALGAAEENSAPTQPGLVVYSEEVWRRLAQEHGRAVLVPLFSTRDNAPPQPSEKRVVVPFGGDEVRASAPVIQLPAPERLTAAEALREDAELDFETANRLAALARRSMPALVRRRSSNPSFKRPPWAQPPASSVFAPLVLVGSWAMIEPDQTLVADLVGQPWREIERVLRFAADSDDRPFLPAMWAWYPSRGRGRRCGLFSGGSTMASTAHTDLDASPADDHALLALARRLAALLGPDGLHGGEGLVSAGDVAVRLGVRRGWVYDHADELGVVRLGDGPDRGCGLTPRRSLSASCAAAAGERRTGQGPVPAARTAAAPGPPSSLVPLLPIKPPTRPRGRPTVE